MDDMFQQRTIKLVLIDWFLFIDIARLKSIKMNMKYKNLDIMYVYKNR